MPSYDHSYEREIFEKAASGWIAFAKTVFESERLAFEIDDKGGVHPKIDTAFQSERHEIVRGLGDPKHARAKGCVEEAYQHFREGTPAGYKASIRSVFEAVETVFQNLVGDRLNRGSIENKLVPLLADTWKADEPKTWTAIGKSLASWADAFHLYGDAIFAVIRVPRFTVERRVQVSGLESGSIRNAPATTAAVKR
jgi:hypothetical protein